MSADYRSHEIGPYTILTADDWRDVGHYFECVAAGEERPITVWSSSGRFPRYIGKAIAYASGDAWAAYAVHFERENDDREEFGRAADEVRAMICYLMAAMIDTGDV